MKNRMTARELREAIEKLPDGYTVQAYEGEANGLQIFDEAGRYVEFVDLAWPDAPAVDPIVEASTPTLTPDGLRARVEKLRGKR